MAPRHPKIAMKVAQHILDGNIVSQEQKVRTPLGSSGSCCTALSLAPVPLSLVVPGQLCS